MYSSFSCADAVKAKPATLMAVAAVRVINIFIIGEGWTGPVVTAFRQVSNFTIV